MDNGDLTDTTENQPATERRESTISDTIAVTTIAEETVSAILAEAAAAVAVANEQHDKQLITSNVKVEIETDISATNLIDSTTDTIAVQHSTDPVLNSVDLEIKVKNSSLPTASNHVKFSNLTATYDGENSSNVGLSSLDAALDNLNDQVTSLLDETSASNVKSDSPDAPLDEALATLNNEVLGLLKESRKIQDELKKFSDSKDPELKSGSRCGSSQGIDKKGGNQYFDYSLYRERSQSPPPHPLITYKWEDIRRNKEKGGYPWTYLNPQDVAERAKRTTTTEIRFEKPREEQSILAHLDQAEAVAIQIEQQTLGVPTALFVDSNAPTDILSFNFENIDTQRAIDSYSVKSSVKNSSSGILEVLQDLEAEAEREKERKKLNASTTQSHQDLTDFKPKEESKRFALRSFLKRSHSAPKKVQVSKTRADDLDEREKSPQQVKCCHPIVEKLKTMADKQLHKKGSKKTKSTIKTERLADDKKIVLAEQTKIIRLKGSPKAEHKNVATYLEKRDSDEIVEILQLDESPSESRKRREEIRKIEEEEEEEKEKEFEKVKEPMENMNDDIGFVVPSNLTGSDTEPTVEELLEEEFKNDPPKKAPRKTKEHIYEEIETQGAITHLNEHKLKKPGNLFASAVLHSVLNKDEFKEGLQKQNKIEDAEEDELKKAEELLNKALFESDDAKQNELADSQMNASKNLNASTNNDSKPIPDEIIDLKSVEEEIKTIETQQLEEVKDHKDSEAIPISEIEIKIDESVDVENAASETEENASKSDERKNVLVKEEKKVKFSQSTEEYQEKLAAEKGPDKEDVELPEHIKVSKRWSNMSDHEYEPIGEPVATTKLDQSFERPVVKITEPESPTIEPESQSEIVVHEDRISFDGTESPIRSITPYTDNSRTEDIHTSQIDDSVIEELPLRREDRKKKSFGETTKNLQNKISSQASNLRTKFKRSFKSGSGGSSQKASGSSLKSSLKSSPKTSQTSPKERKKFKRIDFTNKIKSIHMPKMPKPELPKFKMPEKFKLSRGEAAATSQTTETVTTVDEPSSSALGTTDGSPTVVSVVTTEEIIETKNVPKKRFEFGSYPKIFNRFKAHPTKSDENSHDVTDFVSEDNTERDTATQPSSSSFSTHFATVPRTASKIKNSLISKWNKTSFSRNSDREDSESIPQSGSIPRHDDLHEDSVERRIRLASKMSMEDEEEEALGILQTKEQIQLASYDEENRAIHEISRAREKEFKARKPLTHQDSDIISDESLRDIDWEECERMRNKIMGAQRTPTYEFEDEPKRDSHGRRLRNDSNFSTEETQSSGSSGDRRRTGVIEDIDDDEFFLRQRGVSEDNAEISKYISSAIREGHASFSYDDNNVPDEEYQDFTEQPRKPLRRRTGGFNRSYGSYDDYHHENISDSEIPVATQYFPRHDGHDDENISFYDNEFVDDLDHPNILSREEHFDSDIDNEEFRPVKPEVPKRRRKPEVPKRRSAHKQESIEANEEVLVYRSEPSFTVPDDEPSDTHFVVKPVRKNRSISSKSDLAPDNNQEIFDQESTTIEKHSPSNSRYTINIKDINGYATVKKEPPVRPPAPTRRRKRSTKSQSDGDTLQPEIPQRSNFKDSPFPERQKRGLNAPSRPPRRGSSSSLIDQHKPPSIAPSDGTQYEEIDDELNDEDNEFYPNKMHNRPLPPPPRPPRDKRRRHKSNIDEKFDDNDDDAEQIVVGSFDDSEFSTREFIGAEMATQTSMDIDDLYLNEDVPIDNVSTGQYTRTVEEILRSSDTQPTQNTFKISDDNLSKGIQKFRESNQRSYSERSRTSTERQSSRPITPSALVIEQRITRSPVQTDATLIMQPVDDPSGIGYRTDSAESEYVPYADDVDDTHLDTEDERIINAAIRRYQMLGNDLDEQLSLTPRESTPKTTDENNLDIETKATIEVPQPPPRRKSSANANQINDTINVPLAEPETLSVASTQDLNQYTPEPVNDLSSENIEPTHAQVDSLTVVNIQSTETETTDKPETKPIVNNLQITQEVMQEIIERVRETLPIQSASVPVQLTHEPIESETKVQEEIVKKNVTETETETKEKTSEEPKDSEEPPKRPPTPTDYTPTSEIPASFFRLRTGISDDESSIPPSAIPKHRPRKHARRPESSSDEECNRRHHHHTHHGQSSRSQDLSIADLSGQLIRACGRALSSSLNTAGHSLIDFLRSLTKNQDDQQKDLSLVLVILIIIVASLMMLGISGDRSVHHHHWDFLNPPDNLGRR